MKTKLYNKYIFAFLLIPVLAFATISDNGHKGKYTKEKKIKKEYKVNADALLKVRNSYGHINITAWNENRIVIEVLVRTNGNDEEKVIKKLEDIDVLFEANATMVSAKTIFNKNNNSKSWWNWNNGNNNVNMEINYTIKMPIRNSVNLNNDYGSITLDRIEGVATINCDYGKVTLGELLADNNSLNFDYSSKSTIGFMKSGKINADYSSFTLEKTDAVMLNADYTQSTIEHAGNVEYSCDYGSLKVENVTNFKGNGDYLTTRLGRVQGNVSIRSDYGSIKIEKMEANAGNIDINSDYTGIKIGIDDKYHFDFDITIEYGSLNTGNQFVFNKKVVKSSDKYYQGYNGKEGTGKRVMINSEYGSVSFEKEY